MKPTLSKPPVPCWEHLLWIQGHLCVWGGKHGGQMSRLFTIKQNQRVNYAITSPVLRGLWFLRWITKWRQRAPAGVPARLYHHAASSVSSIRHSLTSPPSLSSTDRSCYLGHSRHCNDDLRRWIPQPLSHRHYLCGGLRFDVSALQGIRSPRLPRCDAFIWSLEQKICKNS